MPSLDSSINVYPLENYSFKHRTLRLKNDVSIPTRLLRLKNDFPRSGIQITVMAVILAHKNNMIHVLLIRKPASPELFLPECELKPGQTEESGLKCLLEKYFELDLEIPESLASSSETPKPVTSAGDDIQMTSESSPPQPPSVVPGGKIIDLIANWWRPNFEPDQYPYVPAHISQPKELTRLYLISLPEKFQFSLPKGCDVCALPLFEIYSDTERYGNIISNLPQVLSRFNFNFIPSGKN